MIKKILITVSTATIARNILRTGVLSQLRSPERNIILVVPQEKYESYQKEFSAPGVEILAYPVLTASVSDRMLSFLARNALSTDTIRMWQKMEFHWNKRYAAYFWKIFLRAVLGRSVWFHGFIRFLYKTLPPQKELIYFLRETKPDILFVTDAFMDTDINFWRAAKRLGTKTIVMIRSWDNLTNHGLIRMTPEKLIVHNPFLKRLAVVLHHIPESKISMVGLPHYDWYIKKELFLNQKDFCKKLSIDPSKKLILFAGIGDYLAPHDAEVVRMVSEAVGRGEISFPAGILFRPHPAFTVSQGDAISSLKHVIWDYRSGQDGARGRGEMGQEEMAHLVNSLRHADLVITTASTMAIDAVAFDKPVICIGFDGESAEPYWNSVARYYADFTHYKMITETGGFKIAYNRDELVKQINEYLKNPRLDEKGRKKIFEDYIWKLDGGSAERLSGAILQNF